MSQESVKSALLNTIESIKANPGAARLDLPCRHRVGRGRPL